MTIVSLYKEINLPFNSHGNLKEYIAKPSFRKKNVYNELLVLHRVRIP